MYDTYEKIKNTVEVNGSAREEFEPDVMHLTFIASEKAETSAQAVRIGGETLEEFLRDLTGIGIDPSKIRLTDESVAEGYNKDGAFHFKKRIEVSLSPDLALLESITALIPKSGGIEYSVRFDLSDIERCENEVLVKAVEASRRKAEIIASAVGKEIAECGSVCCDCDNVGAGVYRLAAASARNSESLASRLDKRKITVEKSVTAVWIMK